MVSQELSDLNEVRGPSLAGILFPESSDRPFPSLDVLIGSPVVP